MPRAQGAGRVEVAASAVKVAANVGPHRGAMTAIVLVLIGRLSPTRRTPGRSRNPVVPLLRRHPSPHKIPPSPASYFQAPM